MIQSKPAYKKIYDSIQGKILDEEYSVGTLLPSEAELEKLFNVSRTPVRQALKQLENDGYIFRVQGKGSFVANHKPKELWTQMSGFKELYSKDWQKISIRTIDQKMVKSEDYAKLLGMGEDENMTFLSRVRYLNGESIMYLEHFVKPVLPLEVYEKDPTFISVQQLLYDQLDIEYTESIEELESVIADPYIAGILQLPTNTPLLKGTRISYDKQNTPIDINIFYVNTSNYKYSVRYEYN